eukprot:jgi/Botrbrau1/19627/Bobra.0828s0004.1
MANSLTVRGGCKSHLRPTPSPRLTGKRRVSSTSWDPENFLMTSAEKEGWREWLHSLQQPVRCDSCVRSPLVSMDSSKMAELLDASWDARQDSLQLGTPTSGGAAVYKESSIVSQLLHEYAAEAGCHGPLPEPSAPIQAMETPAEPLGLNFAAVAGSLPASTVHPGESRQDPALAAQKSSFEPPVAWPPSPFAEAAAAKQLPVGVPGRALASSAPPPSINFIRSNNSRVIRTFRGQAVWQQELDPACAVCQPLARLARCQISPGHDRLLCNQFTSPR